MISKNEFINRLNKLNSFKSKRGETYSDLSLNNNILSFKRDSSGKKWDLNLDDVYNVYLKENYLNTVVIRKHMSGNVYSPSLGLLMATGLFDEKGNRKIN
jgi:hypothetical protein